MQKKVLPTWKRMFFSQTLVEKNRNHKIAYIAVMTAFVVVANMFFEFKLADTQFSFTLAVSALVGVVLGPVFGFIACFLGDLVGFLYHSAGFAYMPWIGISMGLTASIFGLVFIGMQTEKTFTFFLKVAVGSLLSFLLCTIAINTTAFWLLYAPTTPYWTYLVGRLFLKGQIWNSLMNYGLLFFMLPLLYRIKAFK